VWANKTTSCDVANRAAAATDAEKQSPRARARRCTQNTVNVAATTERGGRVIFTGLPKGTWNVNAEAKGWLPAGEERVILEKDTNWELMLEKAVLTTVLVVDERGVPVPGAELWTGNLDQEFQQNESRKVGVTNGSGEFEFPFTWDGKAAILFVMKEGMSMGMVEPDDPSEGEVMKVKLLRAKTLRGTVTDKAGQPIEGAMIYIEVTLEDIEADDLYVTLYTDKKGKYHFPYLAPGEVFVEVSADGYLDDDFDFETDNRREHVRDFTLEIE